MKGLYFFNAICGLALIVFIVWDELGGGFPCPILGVKVALLFVASNLLLIPLYSILKIAADDVKKDLKSPFFWVRMVMMLVLSSIFK